VMRLRTGSRRSQRGAMLALSLWTGMMTLSLGDATGRTLDCQAASRAEFAALLKSLRGFSEQILPSSGVYMLYGRSGEHFSHIKGTAGNIFTFPIST